MMPLILEDENLSHGSMNAIEIYCTIRWSNSKAHTIATLTSSCDGVFVEVSGSVMTTRLAILKMITDCS